MKFKLFFLFSFMILGAKLTLYSIEKLEPTLFEYGNMVGVRLVVCFFGGIISLPIGLLLTVSYCNLKEKFLNSSTEVFLFRSLVIITALMIAQLLFGPIYLIFFAQQVFPHKQFVATFFNFLFISFGITIADLHHRYLSTILTPNFLRGLLIYENLSQSTTIKFIDTNTVINHKLYECIETGFLEGTILIPQDVIIDLYKFKNGSSEKTKRRGTRGLLVLNKLKKVYYTQILIDFLLQDASISKENCFFLQSDEKNEYNASFFTNKHTIFLNKLIKDTRVPYLYGEVFSLRVVRKGNRLGQGIGYLEDGTMVIVEKGYPYIGQKITVTLKKVWQRSSGTILFTYPQNLILANRIRKRKEKRSFEKKSNLE